MERIDRLRLKRAHARIKEDAAYSRMLRASNTFSKWHLARRKLEDRIFELETKADAIALRLLK